MDAHYEIKSLGSKLSQCLNSSDLASCDLWLFIKLKKNLGGSRFEDVEKMKGTERTDLDTFTGFLWGLYKEAGAIQVHRIQSILSTTMDNRVLRFEINKRPS